MQLKSKDDAQRRADQIGSFQKEIMLLEQQQVISLSNEQRTSISTYHKSLLNQLSDTFDIDISTREKQLSLGMKIASFLGALALAASIFFLFYQFWGNFTSTVQVGILLAAPILTLLATMYAARKEQTGYFTKLCGVICFACFVLNLSMLGQIFNITPSPNAFFIWALFAFCLAYASDTRLLLAAGIICFSSFLSAKTATWGGCYWIHFGERPENFFPAALILFLISFVPHHRFTGFPMIYRVFAMLLVFLPVLILSNWGGISYLPLPIEGREGLYQVLGFLLSGIAIWFGIRRKLPEVVNSGNVFFTIFLYTKFYDWWWHWMPKYLFFLAIGLSAIFLLLILKRMRNVAESSSEEGSL